MSTDPNWVKSICGSTVDFRGSNLKMMPEKNKEKRTPKILSADLALKLEAAIWRCAKRQNSISPFLLQISCESVFVRKIRHDWLKSSYFASAGHTWCPGSSTGRQMSQAPASLLAPTAAGEKRNVSNGEFKFIDLCEDSMFLFLTPPKKMFPHLYIEYVMYDLRVFAPHFSMEIVNFHVRKAMAFWSGAWATKIPGKFIGVPPKNRNDYSFSHVQVYETPLE